MAVLPFLGPAFIASIAYIDPGNFATNIQGGAQFGYALLWVILMANLMAMLLQTLSAKLGIATGKNLAEMCRNRFSRGVCYTLWITQEFTAMATDLAEFLGAAIGLNLLLHIPLGLAAAITGVLVFAILAVTQRGFRGLEFFIGGAAGVIALCYVVETLLAKPDWGQILFHTFVPSLPGSDAVLLSVGIIGATVMPHVIYLHSSLTQHRIVPHNDQDKHRIFHFEKIDVVIAMGVAGLVNMAMLFMAAKGFQPHRARRCGGNPDRLSNPYSPARRGGRGGVPDLAGRLRDFQLSRGNHGGSGCHAGVCRFSNPDMDPSTRHDDSRADRDRPRA